MKVWPAGYLEKEAAYCEREERIFWAVDSDLHRDWFRPDVLRKREEFRLLWEAKHARVSPWIRPRFLVAGFLIGLVIALAIAYFQ